VTINDCSLALFVLITALIVINLSRNTSKWLIFFDMGWYS